MTAVPALAVEDLSVEFRTRSGTVKVLEQVGFSVDKGETVALVGESGSGKSVTAFAVANGRYFGGGMMVAPDARLDDGTFNLTIWSGFGLFAAGGGATLFFPDALKSPLFDVRG